MRVVSFVSSDTTETALSELKAKISLSNLADHVRQDNPPTSPTLFFRSSPPLPKARKKTAIFSKDNNACISIYICKKKIVDKFNRVKSDQNNGPGASNASRFF